MNTTYRFSRSSLLFFASILSVLLSFSVAALDSPLVIAGNKVAPGSRMDLTLEVPAGAHSPDTHIPVTVINGAGNGRVLAAVAGVHGYEYVSVVAVERWIETLDPKSLNGALIVVRVAHVQSFQEKSVYVNPYDRKNLNRSFPGKADGTQTERIAWAISQHVVAHADFLLDLHSGDGGEWLAPFTGAYGGPLATDYPLSIKVAEAFQFPNIVTYKMNTQHQVDNKRSLNRQGVAAGISTLLVEIGENGSARPEHVAALTKGLNASLAVLGIRKPSVKKEAANLRANLSYYEGTSSVPVPASGLWFPQHKKGRVITKGETLGVLKDYFGKQIAVITAPVSGYAIYGLTGPAVKKGQSVMTIAKPAKRPEID